MAAHEHALTRIPSYFQAYFLMVMARMALGRHVEWWHGVVSDISGSGSTSHPNTPSPTKIIHVQLHNLGVFLLLFHMYEA
jgi:hypothetical protein